VKPDGIPVAVPWQIVVEVVPETPKAKPANSPLPQVQYVMVVEAILLSRVVTVLQPLEGPV
jgi:hypothetical protein